MLNKKDLVDLLKFTEFTNLFAGVYRKTITNKDGSLENNAQHSFQMAMLAWYICYKLELDLDLDLVLKYALVHDLVETYSGNFPAYSRTQGKQQLKDDNETLALQKIKEDLKDFKDLVNALENYLKLADRESKFIYALDKLIPIINIELNNNDFYFKSQTTYEEMLKVKDAKIAKDPVIYEYFQLLSKYLKEDVNFFWPANRKRNYSQKDYSFDK